MFCFSLSASPQSLSQPEIDFDSESPFFGKSAFNTAVGYRARTKSVVNMEYTIDGNPAHVLSGKARSRFMVEADSNVVYDTAYKKHQLQIDNVKIEYVEYAHSNSLQFTIDGNTYKMDCIDGDCYHSIANLAFYYSTTPKGEIFTLFALDDIRLKGKRTTLTIRKGSQMVEYIKR